MNIDNTKVREFVKQLKDECRGYRNFYTKIKGEEPTKQQVQTLTNYVNRSAYSLEFMLSIIEAFDLYNVTFEQLCNGEVPKRRKKRKIPEADSK